MSVGVERSFAWGVSPATKWIGKTRTLASLSNWPAFTFASMYGGVGSKLPTGLDEGTNPNTEP